MALEEILDELPRKAVDLTGTDDDPRENDPHRPELKVWAGIEDGQPAHVTLSFGALWGQQLRFADMMPGEARKLGRALIDMADAVDTAVDNYEPPDPPGFEGGFAPNH